MGIGLLLGLGAAVMWGLTDVSASVASRRFGSVRVLAGAHLAGWLVLVIIGLLRGVQLPSDLGILVSAVAVGLFGAGAYLAFFTGLRIGPLAVVSPTVAAFGGLTVILSVLFLGETLTPLQAVGAVLATIGVVFVGFVSDGNLRETRIVGSGVLFGFAALVLFALMTIASSTPIREVGWLEFSLLARTVNVVAVWLLLVASLATNAPALRPFLAAGEARSRRGAIAILLAGLLDVAGLISFTYGLEVAETWIVGLASSFGPAIAVVVAVLFMRERLRPTQWLGLGILAAGLGAVALP
ncbi:MAG: DMT family transporter [Chloroflexota bacterium]